VLSIPFSAGEMSNAEQISFLGKPHNSVMATPPRRAVWLRVADENLRAVHRDFECSECHESFPHQEAQPEAVWELFSVHVYRQHPALLAIEKRDIAKTPYKERCPVCNAPPGKPCKRLDGGPKLAPHSKRERV
jgi:hypothetical protein